MNTVLTVINENVNLKNQHVLAYLKPQTNNDDWEAVAWQTCSPQSGGGEKKLDAITNEIGAYVTSDNDTSKSAYQIIAPQYISSVLEDGNMLSLTIPELDTINLTEKQCGIKNTTTRSDIYPIWCINKSSIGKPTDPMYNNAFSSFELLPKIYFTIGSSTSSNTFRYQNWDELVSFDISPNLLKANIIVKLDEATNKIKFTMKDPVFG